MTSSQNQAKQMEEQRHKPITRSRLRFLIPCIGPRLPSDDADIGGGPRPPASSLMGSPLPLQSSSSGREPTFFGGTTEATIQGGRLINHNGNVTKITNNYYNPNDRVMEGQETTNIPHPPAPTRQDHSSSQGPSLVRRNPNTRQAPIIKSPQRSNKIYESHLKLKDRGYPLWMPQPGMGFPIPYRTKGISIGDVGTINAYGGFDFLFNVCLPHGDPINPAVLPNGFVPVYPSLGPIDVGKVREFAPGSFLTASSVTMGYHNNDSPALGMSFKCSDPEGAILTIPDGAYHEELVNVSRFKRYMIEHLENWYKFANGRHGREAKNGDIHLVVGCDKTTTWGMAVFSNPPQTTSRLTFRLDRQSRMSSGCKHVWEHSALAGEVRVGPGDGENDELGATPERPLQNQCLFVRTLNVLLADDVWAKLEAALLAAYEETSDSDFNTELGYTSRSQSHASGTGNSSSTSFNGTQNSQGGNQLTDQLPVVGEDDPPLVSTHHSFRVTEFTPSPPIIHPSKILNKFLLSQKPDAIMAITHDRDWYSLLNNQDAAFPDPSVLVQRVRVLNDICEDNGIVYLHPKRRDQRSIDEEKAQISKLRLDLATGRMSLLVYLFGNPREAMESQLLKTIVDLNNFISSPPRLLERQVPLSLPRYPDRLLILDDLLRLLRDEFVYEDVQEESIPSLWNKLNSFVMQDASQPRIQCILRLGSVLQRRYSRLNLVDDLEDAIHCYHQAVSLSLPSKSHFQHLDANLGLASSIYQRYIAKGHLEDLIILKRTLEQRMKFDIQMMLQPIEDQLLENKGRGIVEGLGLQDKFPMPEVRAWGTGPRTSDKSLAQSLKAAIRLNDAAPAGLPSRVEETFAACPQFRIVVIGNTGVGKSSLVRSVFNLSSDPEQIDISHDRAGKANIEREYSSKENPRFILHDSMGFEHGSREHWDIVEKFLRDRASRPHLRDRVHAIWLCLETPRTGSRVMQTGDEELLTLAKKLQIPVIAVFTKYDILVNEHLRKLVGPMCPEKHKEARTNAETYFIGRVQRVVRLVPGVQVSTEKVYLRETLLKLTNVTRATLRNLSGPDATFIPWAAAQQVSGEQKVELSISEGFKKSWKDLKVWVASQGHHLLDCIARIHDVILSFWNFNDPLRLLSRDDFKANMIQLAEPFLTRCMQASRTAKHSPDPGDETALPSFAYARELAAVGVSTSGIKFLYGTYHDQKLTSIAQYLDAYIVDLILVLHCLFRDILLVQASNALGAAHVYSALTTYKEKKSPNIHQKIQGLMMKPDFQEPIAALIRESLSPD